MVLMLIVMMGLFSFSTQAQDNAEETDTPAVVNEADTGVGIVGDSVPVVDNGNDNLQVNVITIVIGLLSAFAAGGVVGIAGVASYVNRIKDDVSTVTAIEGLANSYPPQTKDLVESIFQTIKNIGELGVEAFDGVPMASKTNSVFTEDMDVMSGLVPAPDYSGSGKPPVQG